MKKVILARLFTVRIPGMRLDLVSSGMVGEKDIAIDGDKVVVTVNVPADFSGDLAELEEAVEQKLAGLEGIGKLLVVLTADRPPAPEPPKLRKDRPTEAPVQDARPTTIPVHGVKHVVAVASGKGGVGKSTVAVNLALGLRSLGFRAGILDADIYGPSVPRLLGIDHRPDIEDDRIVPIMAHGLQAMSIGFIMEEESPIIWRGPIAASALMQLTHEVAWDDLDVLVLDMPPGTGDAQLTMAQQVPLAGAVIVSTPQDLALQDARKGLRMFKNAEVPIFGIVENMSTFICPHCGEASDIFGRGGAQADAERLGVPFLGAVPLHMEIRETSDAGLPVMVSNPDSPHAEAFRKLALNVAARLFPEDDED